MWCLTKGDILICNNEKWRVIEFKERTCLLVMLDTKQTHLVLLDKDFIFNELNSGNMELFSSYGEEERFEIETGGAIKINERNRSVAKELLERDMDLFWLENSHKRRSFINEMAEKYDVSHSTIRRFLCLYLQNNLSLSGIKCKYYRCGAKGQEREYKEGIRPGNKGISKIALTKEVLDIFNSTLQRYISTKGRLSISMVYSDMCQKYYSEEKYKDGEWVYDVHELASRPTKRQLYYYIKKNLSSDDKYIVKNGIKAANNDIRALESDTINDLDIRSIGGRYELDAMETDFYLVDRYDSNKVIGRAILYLAVDVYSKMICGFNVGLDNNAWAGLELLLLNMVEDKVEVCARAGIEIKEDEWPVSGVLPMELEMDNGSDFISDDIKRYAAENGINLIYVPSRMGSYKPNVEQKFRQLNSLLKGRIPGQIVKEEYGQKHISGARINIMEFHKIVLECILSYNKMPMKKYQSDKSIFESGIIPSPINIWNFKRNQANGLRKIGSMKHYTFSLLREGKAKITREGIEFNKALYLCNDMDWLRKEMRDVKFNGVKKLDIRYDVRNMNFIQFTLDGEIIEGYLNPNKTINEKYQDLTYYDVIECNESRKIMDSKIDELRLSEQVNLNKKIDLIVKDATKQHKGINSKKDIKENRKVERDRLHNEAQVAYVEAKDISIEENRTTSMGLAPVLNEIKSMNISKLSRAEMLRLEERLNYEVDVLGYERE